MPMNKPPDKLRFSRRDLIKTCGVAVALAAISGQSGRAQSPIRENGPALAGDHWPLRRDRIARAWLGLLGDPPVEVPDPRQMVRKVTLAPGCPSERLTPVQREVLRTQMAWENGAIERYHVSFQAEDDDRVTAWLLVPKAARRQRSPAMICIHSTTLGAGKDATIGLSGPRPQDPPDSDEGGRSYGLHLARHGYVTLSIDLLTDGERIGPGGRLHDTRPFYQRHPEWSIVGKNNWDISRSVDFLQTLDYVDPRHIGCVGLSLGGQTVVFAAAFEPRLAATISIGAVLDWHRPNGPWARSDTPVLPDRGPYIFIRKFRPYVENPALPVPTDFDELMMLVAPRPMLILKSEWEFDNRRNLLDKCLDVARVYRDWKDAPGLSSVIKARQQRKSYAQTLSYYKERTDIGPERMEGQLRRIGAGDSFGWFSYPGGHSYPPVTRQYSFAWLDRWLDRDQRWYGRYVRS
jgi:dienelactone hydrolase